MRIKRIALLAAAAFLPCLPGCSMLPTSAMYKTEDTAFIPVIAVDFFEDNQSRYTVTVADQEEKAEGVFGVANVCSAGGQALAVAFKDLKTSSTLTPFFGHASYLLLGDGIKYGEDLSTVFGYFLKDPEFKLSSAVFLIEGDSAGGLLAAYAQKQPISAILDTLSANLQKEYEFTSPKISDVLQTTHNPRRATLIPIIKLTDDQIKITGAGYFMNGWYKDKISLEDYWLMSFLSGKAKNITIDLTEYEPLQSAVVTKSRVLLEPYERGGKIVVPVSFAIDAEVPHGLDKEEARGMIRGYFMRKSADIIQYQIDTGADFINLSDRLYKYHADIYEKMVSRPDIVRYDIKFIVNVSEVEQNV